MKEDHPKILEWILYAIGKIRYQKQRPNVERICHTVRQNYDVPIDDKAIEEHLEAAVAEGAVSKVFNKGQTTYRDPGRVRGKKVLNITKNSDLSKIVVGLTRELGQADGCQLTDVEERIKTSFTFEPEVSEVDLKTCLRLSVKKAVTLGLLTQEGKLLKLTPRSRELIRQRGDRKSEGGYQYSKKRLSAEDLLNEDLPKVKLIVVNCRRTSENV